MTNEELKNNEQSEFEEIEEKDLKAVSGGCGTSTPEPEPVYDPHNCPGGGQHEGVAAPGTNEGLCSKCGNFVIKDGKGKWITTDGCM